MRKALSGIGLGCLVGLVLAGMVQLGAASLPQMLGFGRTTGGVNVPLLVDSQGRLATSGGGGGSGTVTSIATTSPLAGGTITTTGTLSCPTCVVGPTSVTTAHLAVFNGTTGKLIADGGAVPTNSFPGTSTNTQALFNNSGSVAGFGSWDGTKFTIPGTFVSYSGSAAIPIDTPTTLQSSISVETDGYNAVFQNKTYSTGDAAYWGLFVTDTGTLGLDTPTFGGAIFFGLDGSFQAKGGYKSADGSTGATVTTCTSFKNGLCVAGT